MLATTIKEDVEMRFGPVEVLGLSGVLLASAALGCSSGEPLGDAQYEVKLSSKADDFDHPPSKDSTGKAYIDTTTGLVEIFVEDMPALPGQAYEGWLAGGDEDAVTTGVIELGASGFGSSEIVLGDISDLTYERVVITVEPDPDDDPGPDLPHSISGKIRP